MELFRFANPDNLLFLLALPAVITFWLISMLKVRRSVKRFGDKKLFTRLMPERSAVRVNSKFFILLLSYVFLVIAAARPQYVDRIEEVRREGAEVIIALDVSNSMLAEDIRPNRLERSKQAISRLVDQIGDDRIGLIVFAGDAYTQVPVTSDYVSLKMFLSNVNTDIVSKQGTAIGEAIKLGIKSFSPNSESERALIIITDGENHEDDPLEAAKEAVRENITIFAIGIGSPEGAPIPLKERGETTFLQDHEGNTVITRLDEEILLEIVSITGGKYVRATTSNLGLNEIYSAIAAMKGGETEKSVRTGYDDQFYYFAAAALLLLLTNMLIMDRKNRRLMRIKLLKTRI